ncbi:stalk domain-containing protein [Paenibacillus silvae]|uniref:stalk domain-containing protein n=1 Tax=Paenibacillus silvae TaxID=1325358 RepID=UPI003CF516CD
MNLKKKLSILTAFAVFQAFAVIPANAQAAESNETTPVNTAKVKSVEVVKKEQPIAESEVKSGTASEQTTNPSTNATSNTQPADNESTIETETKPETSVPSATEVTPVTPETGAGEEQGTTEENGSPVPAEVEQPTTGTTSAAASSGGDLTLYMNSNKMVQDGKTYLAGRPMAVKNGVSYVAIRALVDRVGYDVKYDNKTKETIIISGTDELRFKTNSNVYTVNGQSRTMKGPAYQEKNTFMIPLTSITQALNITYTVNQSAKTVVLKLNTKPVASFTVQNEIFAGDPVTYTTKSSSPSGLPIVNEQWTGRQDSFDQPGVYTVTYTVQDSSGQWSNPFTLTIKVERPNLPPVAMFTTDKEEYKMGEKITYIDQSTDDENAIEKRVWDNNSLAFFIPGPKTVSLTVTDKHGLSNTYTKTIMVTGETLYTLSDFNQLFTPVGDKFTFNGGEVPAMEKIPYTYTDEPSLLIRSNSPETVNQEGIVYKESSFGQTRFMIHHVNNTGKRVKMYVIATNNNPYTAVFEQQNMGFAGPTPFATVAGKLSIDKWFKSMQTGADQKKIYLQPGESKLILTELSATPMKEGQVISLYSDTFSDYTLDYNIVMIEENKDPMAVLSSLPVLDRDGVHNRGTYPNATRIITYDQEVGSKPARLPLGDNASDPNLDGTDPMAFTIASNAGNFGVLYKITLNNVAPRTLISFNPRGGKYYGSALVNGQLVQLSNDSRSLSAPNEQGVLYRTGSYGESVTIIFSAAPGSNLPVNLLFTPLPAEK